MIERLRRVTRSGLWIPEVDGLRFVAICAVFLFHMFLELSTRSGRIIPVEAHSWWLARLLGNGHRGVSLFFVISGMILALPFARHFLLRSEPVSLRKYYLRRVTRLEPPYIASIIIAITLTSVYQGGFTVGLHHVLASAFYVHSLVFGRMSSVNVVTWSLEVEIQFYLLAPVVMQFYRIRRASLRRAVMLGIILGVELLQVVYPMTPRVQLSIVSSLQYFLVGLIVADIFVLDLDKIRFSWFWDLAGIAALGVIFWTTESVFLHLFMPIATAVLCVAAMRSHALRSLLGSKGIAVIGGMCYSIYLLHFLLISVLFKLTRRIILPQASFFSNYVIQLSLIGIPVLAMCITFFLLIERPCMAPNWPSQVWQKITGRRKIDAELADAGGR